MDLHRFRAVDLAILVIAYLIATYFRQTLPVGKFVGENYDWFAPGIYGAIALGAGIAHLALLAPRLSGRLGSRRGRLAAAVLALLGALLALTVLMPLQSGLQKGYFFGAALILVAVLTFATDFWTRVKAIIDGLLGNNQGQNGDG